MDLETYVRFMASGQFSFYAQMMTAAMTSSTSTIGETTTTSAKTKAIKEKPKKGSMKTKEGKSSGTNGKYIILYWSVLRRIIFIRSIFESKTIKNLVTS